MPSSTSLANNHYWARKGRRERRLAQEAVTQMPLSLLRITLASSSKSSRTKTRKSQFTIPKKRTKVNFTACLSERVSEAEWVPHNVGYPRVRVGSVLRKGSKEVDNPPGPAIFVVEERV